ncbi:hypothetical protein B0H17DRAFT_458222 [Mycena rosella]|uniref:Uncharacterized protein n=1 Tax=Mycena rosella TaxID=1033263 RepID=A0AAD7CDB5_MYCRO|nr:hypothetical protein B0H17DRAFT_458222 [Mycena rosella]
MPAPPAAEDADAVEVPRTAADLLGYHERNAGRLVVDPAEARRAFGKAVAARLKLSADGRGVLWLQPTADPEDPQNWSDARKSLQLLIIMLASIVLDLIGSIGVAAIFPLAAEYRTTADHINAISSNWALLLHGIGGFVVTHVDYKWAYVVGALYSLGVLLMIVVWGEETLYDRLHPPPPSAKNLRTRAETLLGLTGARRADLCPSWTACVAGPLRVVWRPQARGGVDEADVLDGLRCVACFCSLACTDLNATAPRPVCCAPDSRFGALHDRTQAPRRMCLSTSRIGAPSHS